ncbi:MAG: DNA polymerase/3'-5' exonuclease PolX [Tepidisphaeraceae bacterium]|jgi:DNA polymerase (family 10)
MSLNDELSNLFDTLAALLQLKGEPVFKAIAFQKVSRLLGDTSADIRKAAADGTLADMEGIGPSSRKIIEEYVQTGKSSALEEISAGVPPGLITMLSIPGLGAKTVAMLWKERDIKSIEELTAAIDAGRLAGLKGVGEKKIDQIKQGIALHAQAGERMGIVEALSIATAMLEQVRALPGVERAEIAGSLRRRRETIGDVDLICAVAAAHAEAVSKAFTQLPQVKRVLGQGKTKASILTKSGLQVDLRLVPPVHFGAALQYFTGSKDHNVKLRSLALSKGMTLNEWGLYRLSDYDKAEKKTGEPPAAKAVASRTEEEIYTALGLATPDPLVREDRGEIEAATAGTLPVLVQLSDIRGDLHSHTTASDGHDSILEMAEAAKKLGYEFLAITDHSKAQVIANGLTRERLLAHVKEIHRIGEQIKGIKLLAGCEVDILADGRMDFEDEVLAELDIVVGSPHLALRQEEPKATERLLKAIDNRYVNIIGHPTGRLIHRRAGLPLDFQRIFSAAAANGTALEINASYPRLDLNDVHARAAIAAGAKISINTDAHDMAGFSQMIFGVEVARRAWARKGDIINCFTYKSLLEFIKHKRP